MFTEEFLQEIAPAYEQQMSRLLERQKEVNEILLQCTKDEAQALKCLYASMPISDAADYPAEIFLSYARHGRFLWGEGPFAGRVPEDVFAGYVLHHRVNNEDLTDSRPFFYELLKEQIAGKSMEQAILTVNYWCAAEATYRTTDGRTASASCMYRSAYGRCGEESTFLVTVLRSLGIPARQVYVPLWSHCDDNHAWVEAWCDGTWRFLGACEPEEILNKGWFTNASSRAMMVHSRWLLPAEPGDDVVGRRGVSLVLNQLERYGITTQLAVTVLKPDGSPAVSAKLTFEVLNYACFGEIATVHTGADGISILQTGLGTVHITACLDGSYGELMVDTREQTACTLVLGETHEVADEWEQMAIFAPKDAPVNRCLQTPEEIECGHRKQREATECRRKKEDGFYDADLAREACVGYSQEEAKRCLTIMQLSCGNQREIADFLARPTGGAYEQSFKLGILDTLREKDYLDITADILEEHCREAAAYAKDYPSDILLPYILCPRVDNEMIRPFRSFILAWLSEEQKRDMRNDPSLVYTMISERLISDSNLEYGNLITSARGALTSGYGSLLTKKVVSVQILRTLGIPARLNPADGILEVYRDGEFVPIEKKTEHSAKRTASIVVNKQEDNDWVYFHNWTIARFGEEGYETLMLCDESGEPIFGEIALFPGKYRILTANRLPNGNIFASKLVFSLEDGERREIVLRQMEAQMSDLLADHDIADFSLEREDGSSCAVSKLVEDETGLFIWLEEGMEPTEHILNEIYERREAYGALTANLYFVLPGVQAKKNPTLARTLASVPGIQILLDDFDADMEVLARRMYLEPGKLPLTVIIDESMKGLYGSAGYNVGTADMILKILNRKKGRT